MKQTVYVYKCINSTIRVNGKVNSITMDACKKCAIVFDNAVAALEVIGSQSIQAQVTGKVPIVNGQSIHYAQILYIINFDEDRREI